MRSPSLLVVISSAIAFAVGVFGCRPASESDPEGDRSSKADQTAEPVVLDGYDAKEPTLMGELRALRQEVLLLRADLSGVRNKVQQLERRHAANAAVADNQGGSDNRSTGDDEAQNIESPEEVLAARAEAAQRAEDGLEVIEAAFLGEPADPNWSADVSMAIDEALQSEELRGTNVRGVECRSTMCRVEVTHDDPRKRMEFGLWLPQKLAEVLPTSITKQVNEGEGVTGSILFLVRPGRQLPLS